MSALFPEEEIWAPIAAFPGYEVSSKARMRSYWSQLKLGLANVVSVLHETPQRVLVATPNPRGGHPMYRLSRSGTSLCKQAGFWMLEAFVRPWSGRGWYCCHNDGDCLNNDLMNLRWDTKRADVIDLLRQRKRRTLRLTEDLVREIRRLYVDGVRCVTIARLLSITSASVHGVLSGKCWNWVV
jgi:hypothetical protein